MTNLAVTTPRPLDRLLQTHRPPPWLRVSWLVMAAVAAFLVWASVARLDEVALAPAEVVPQGNIRAVQHLEGGIIAEILARDGDAVAAGQALIQLDLASAGAVQADAQVQLDALVLQRARLRAEADGAEAVAFPDVEAARRPDQARAEADTFAARRAQHAAVMEQYGTQLRQRGLEIDQLTAKLQATRADLAIARERLRLSEGLVERDLMPRLEFLTVQQQVEALDGEVRALEFSVPRARAALEETQRKLEEAALQPRREALEDLGELEPRINRQVEMLGVSADQVRRTLVTSPIDGVVKGSRFHTVGGVVRPGEVILEVVPRDDRLVIRSRLSPVDRGYVRVGQPALVKVTAYDYFRFGGLEGTVTRIAADSTQTENGASFFDVTVETDQSALERGGERFPITPGMQAVVEVKTGSRSVLSYLTKPIARVATEGFRER